MSHVGARQRPPWVDGAEATRDRLLGETATRKTYRSLARAYRRLAAWHWIEGNAADDESTWRTAFIAEQHARREAHHWQDRADAWPRNPQPNHEGPQT